MSTLPLLGPRQIGSANYFWLCVAVGCQLATMLITWSLWQVRDQPVHLPWPGLNGISALGSSINWGPWLIGSLVLVLITPKPWGMLAHLGVLAMALSGDQFRCQPQILGITILMAACAWEPARFTSRWYLVAMWTWAGIHKLLSEDWFGSVTNGMLMAIPGMAASYWWFALLVAVAELGLGLLAIIRPRIAAVVCIALHLGIVGFLLLVGWNYSVIPWNLATASIGAWITWTAGKPLLKTKQPGVPGNSPENGVIPRPVATKHRRWRWGVIALLMISPVGFYFGWVRHSFAHVLYSDNFALATVTDLQGVHEIEMMETLGVPFPHTPAAFRQYFQLTGKPGDKLHVLRRRHKPANTYYRLTDTNQLEPISAARFFAGSREEFVGVAYDDPRSRFAIAQSGARLLVRSQGEMIYAVEFQPLTFEASLLDRLSGLPNLEQVQLLDCAVTDTNLDRIPVLQRVDFVGLDNTRVTPQGLGRLGRQPALSRIEYMGSLVDGILLKNLLHPSAAGQPESVVPNWPPAQ